MEYFAAAEKSVRRTWIAGTVAGENYCGFRFRPGANGGDFSRSGDLPDSVSEGVAARVVRSRNGVEPGETGRGVGWNVVRHYRPDHFARGAERGAGGDVRIFDFTSADCEKLCAHDAAVLFERVAVGRGFVGRGFLDRLRI